MTTVVDPFACGMAAQGSLRALKVPPTPDNFAIWYDYHAGINPELTRLIDVLTRNPKHLDDNALAAIHRKFFTHTAETQALQKASERMQSMLREVGSMVLEAGQDAGRFGSAIRDTSRKFVAGTSSLPDLIQSLRDAADEMSGRAERLGQHLTEAAGRIESLEQSLDEVRRTAATDGLTGLANRRAFDARLREIAGRAMNTGEDLALMLLDIDHFKRFNDTWGHQTGDQVLQLVAATLRQHLRPDDLVARYGGEEFAIATPATPAAQAAAVGDRIRTAFEGKRLIARTTGKTIDGITVSIGVTCYDPGEPLDDWFARADKALYAAKHGGRNRVVTATA